MQTKIIRQGDTANEVELAFSYTSNPDDLVIPSDTPTKLDMVNIDTGAVVINGRDIAIDHVADGVVYVVWVPLPNDVAMSGRYRAVVRFILNVDDQLTVPTVYPINVLITPQLISV